MKYTYYEDGEQVYIGTAEFFVSVERGLGGYAKTVFQKIQEKDIDWLRKEFNGRYVSFTKTGTKFSRRDVVKRVLDVLVVDGVKIPVEPIFTKDGVEYKFSVNGNEFTFSRGTIKGKMPGKIRNYSMEIDGVEHEGFARETAVELLSRGRVSWVEAQEAFGDSFIESVKVGQGNVVEIRTTYRYFPNYYVKIENDEFRGIIVTRAGIARVRVPARDFDKVPLFTRWPEIDEKYVEEWLVRWPRIKDVQNVEYRTDGWNDVKFVKIELDGNEVQINLEKGKVKQVFGYKKKYGKLHLVAKYLKEIGVVF